MLDYRLLAFLHRPVKDKFHRGFNKVELRKALPTNIPDSVRWRRDKQGFRYSAGHGMKKTRNDLVDIIEASSYISDRHHDEITSLRTETPMRRVFALCSIALLEQANLNRRSIAARAKSA